MFIAVDSSTILAMFFGVSGRDVDLLRQHLKLETITIPPPVWVEVLSNHETREAIFKTLHGCQTLELEDGYWLRASELRAKILKHGFKAKTADTLIAQCCIDHGVPLITRDTDFKHFAKHGRLKLA